MKRFLLHSGAEVTTRYFDVVIVGDGISGLYVAQNIRDGLSCAVISKEDNDYCNSYFAQGGVAAVVSKDDSTKLHYEDTISAGAGLCDTKAVDTLVNEGSKEIKKLIENDAPFDVDENGNILLTKEGGHSKNRILHCGGDATGKTLLHYLVEEVAKKKNVTFVKNSFLADIITCGGSVCAIACVEDGKTVVYLSNNVIIATGGIGQVFLQTTNPQCSTGDGIAAALRAGAAAINMEFVQFHPTGLYTPEEKDRCFLISEAVRGEGGVLLNDSGERFMVGRHPMAELATRDIVAREIFREMKKAGKPCVWLDITSKSREFLEKRFPQIFNKCLKTGIDISKQPIPVCPVQHYFMGGIKTDINSETSINGLYACGEVSCTGVHGANRLASNSLLECLVFAKRCADKINLNGDFTKREVRIAELPQGLLPANFKVSAKKHEIKEIMTNYGGIIRTKAGLDTAIAKMDCLLKGFEGMELETPSQMEAYNMAMISSEILKAARARETSIGSHYIEN